MATRREHYIEAERLLAAADAMMQKATPANASAESLVAAQQIVIATAQVHATLASIPVSLSVRDT